MGIDVHVYTVYGVQIPMNEELMDHYDDIYNECTADMIIDGMGGEYIILGRILFNSPNFRWNDGDGDVRKDILPEELPEIEREYRMDFARWFPDFTHLLEDRFRLMTLTHYS
jgi:hypothetical protein